MKKLWPNKKSHQLWFLGALLPLTACGSEVVPTDFNLGVNVSDFASTVTVTKTIVTPGTPDTPAIPATPSSPAIPAIPGIPAKVTYTAGAPGVTSFTFGTRAGSDAGYITKFRIVSDKVNGKDVSLPVATSAQQLNIYTPSGFTCDVVNPPDPVKPHSKTQSCKQSDPTIATGSGVITDALTINFAAGLSDFVVATDESAYRTTIVEFSGVTARGKTFAVEAEVNSAAIKTGAP
jgi:hypothetical protein